MVDLREALPSGAAVSAAAARGRVLVVDDDPSFRRLGANWLRSLGHEVETAGDADAGAALATAWGPDAVLLDLSMPPHLDPAAGIANVARFAPAPVIVLTGHADGNHALAAIEAGAWDFLAKPADPPMLAVVVARAVAKGRLEDELRRLRRDGEAGDLGLAGTSPALSRLRDGIRRLGPTRVSVVVLGPTGTGKELVARALHALGPGRDRPFTVVHCGALPGDLLEAELFGHVKGSFTGAHRDAPGLLDAAHGGTLFLDEVGDMPAPLQVKLLRFLQEGTFTPVGARHPRRADARVVSATHRDLAAMVAAGTFREDLFYRLKGMVLRTPALAERPGDAGVAGHPLRPPGERRAAARTGRHALGRRAGLAGQRARAARRGRDRLRPGGAGRSRRRRPPRHGRRRGAGAGRRGGADSGGAARRRAGGPGDAARLGGLGGGWRQQVGGGAPPRRDAGRPRQEAGQARSRRGRQVLTSARRGGRFRADDFQPAVILVRRDLGFGSDVPATSSRPAQRVQSIGSSLPGHGPAHDRKSHPHCPDDASPVQPTRRPRQLSVKSELIEPSGAKTF